MRLRNLVELILTSMLIVVVVFLGLFLLGAFYRECLDLTTVVSHLPMCQYKIVAR